MKHSIIISVLLFLISAIGVTAGEIDLEQEYRKLDKAIEQTDQYVQ